MGDYKETKLVEIVRKSKKNKQVLNRYFNPNNQCFGCMVVSGMKLKDACALKKIDSDMLIGQLD